MAAAKSRALTQREAQLIAKALADPRRVEILKQIGRSSCMACVDLREQQPISAATMSHHIKELEMAGLIEVTREGKYAHMTVRREMLRAYQEYLAGI